MKNVRLKSLELRNFKGITNFRIGFENAETFIHGANRSGKTTLFDAFNWLLFNKNSSNETAFEIKTLNTDGTVKHKLEHEVVGVIEFDNRNLTLRKVLSEKWTKKRGADTEELTGNEIKYFVDDVPKSLAEYKSTIDLIIQESIARTITDPFYFNTVMPWAQRRELLFRIVGMKSDIELLHSIEMDDKQILIDIINSEKTLDDYKKQIKVHKGRFNDEIKSIPARIDEVSRSIVEITNVAEIESKIAELQKAKNEVQALIDNEAEANKETQNEIIKANGLIFELKQQIQNERQRLELELNKGRNDLQLELNKAIAERNVIEEKKFQKSQALKTLADGFNTIDTQLVDLRIKYSEIEASRFVFDESLCACGSCGRAFENETIEERKRKESELFEANKLNALEKIRIVGHEAKVNKENHEKEIQKTKLESEQFIIDFQNASAKVAELETKLKSLPVSEIQDNDFIKQAAAQIEAVVIPEMKSDNSELINKRSAIESTIKEFESKLSVLESNKKAETRVQELKDQLLILNQEKAQLEKVEMLIDKFTFNKITNLENEINSLFEMVKFKMFDEQLNGGIAECCICTIDGVPFSDANTASKVNAGLDVIKTLQTYFEVNAPIFIDNRESVTVLNTGVDMQIINLVVDPEHLQLSVIEK